LVGSELIKSEIAGSRPASCSRFKNLSGASGVWFFAACGSVLTSVIEFVQRP